MKLLIPCALLLVVVASAAASHASPLLIEKLVKPSAGGKQSARVSNYRETELVQTCIKTDTVRNCAALGSFCTGEADVLTCDTNAETFETDFACCSEQHYHENHYSQTDNAFTIGGADRTTTVGSCVWSIDEYDNAVAISANPIVVRLGDIKATCTLNSDHHQQCGGPDCEKMALTLQGHLFATPMSSMTAAPGYSIIPDLLGNLFDGEPSCCNLGGLLDINNDEICGIPRQSGGGKTGARKSPHLRNVTMPAVFKRALKKPATGATKKAAGTATASVQYARHGNTDKYNSEYSEGPKYIGGGVIASGTSYITTVHSSGKESVQETGLFEFALSAELISIAEIEAGGDVVTPEELEQAHFITPQALKLTFKKEKGDDSYYGSTYAN